MPTAMPDLSALLEHGVLGVLLAIALWYIYKLHNERNAVEEQHKRDLKEVQDKRTEDAKLVVDKLLQINDKWNAALSDQLRMMETIEPTLKELRGIMIQAQIDRATGRN